MNTTDFSTKAKQLIDDIKGICVNAGLGGDANEYKIVTQSFLYKFLNDKFLYEVNKLNQNIHSYEDLEKLSDDEFELLMIKLGTKSAHLKPQHLLEYLFQQQNNNGFAKLFDDTLNDIAVDNSDIFSVHTAGNTEIRLFEEMLIQRSVSDQSKHDVTARQIINKLANSKFDFQSLFSAGFDFFSTLFEYMIKDYNKDGGGNYAEYYTPHSIANVMAEILIGDHRPINVTAYDPAAGSGTLLMNIAYKIGPDKCTIFSEDISQKSSNLLRLNLILNNLSHSIDHIVQGNTITEPKHITKKFDFIVSNPPFKTDFSSDHEKILNLPNVSTRFFAGVPNVKPKDKDKMEIYLLFLQHIIFNLSDKGKAAVVVPSGFCTDTGTIHKTIREYLINNGYLTGVIHFPSNIFANTNTSVSVIFLDKSKFNNQIIFVDASRLGKTIKEKDSSKVELNNDELSKITNVFLSKENIPEFSRLVDFEEVKKTEYMIKAGMYFAIDKKSIVKNKLDLSNELELFNQKKSGLTSLLMDSIFRNVLINNVIEKNKNVENSDFTHVHISDLLESAIGGEWGKDFPTNTYQEKIRCIRGTDIPNIRSCNYENIPFRYVKKEHIKSKALQSNDIVIEISGGSPIQSTGRICLITDETVLHLKVPILCTNFCRILRLNDTFIAPYIYHYLKLLYDHGTMFNLENNTSGIKNLIFSAFANNLEILIPKNKTKIQEIYNEVDSEISRLIEA